MSEITDIHTYKLSKMSDPALFAEATRLGMLMERQALAKKDIPWARSVFTRTFDRATDPVLKHACKLATIMLRYY